ncbi:MAG TPA: hypothetical protein VFK20_06410 [Vicinamibacterales bacterium]|nr:hypothetical protein [Vicinamibacterales bacterium]
MKATIVLTLLIVLAVLSLVAEPALMASGLTAGRQAGGATEPALLLISGAGLLAAASVVRRYVP